MMGHVVKPKDGSRSRVILEWYPIANRRRKGGPRKRWAMESGKASGEHTRGGKELAYHTLVKFDID